MKVAIVGEAWGEKEEEAGKPFVGASGWVLDEALQQAGIVRSECLITNTFNFRPLGNKLETLYGTKAEALPNYRPIIKGKYIHKKYWLELERLYHEIAAYDPNVIVACGNTALWALCKKSGIASYRGSPLETFDFKEQMKDAQIPYEGRRIYKVLPTWHPAAVLRQWQLRPILVADLQKVQQQSAFPEVRRPSHLIYMEPTLQDIEDFYHNFLLNQPFLSADIETKDRSITEIGFSTADASRAIVIPFWDRSQPSGNYWQTLEDELTAWRWVRRICAEFPLVGQNFQYDMKYLWRTVGIPCPYFLDDTMLMHHSLQPEMRKSLGFMASIYTDEPSWKFMRTDHSTLKKEDE